MISVNEATSLILSTQLRLKKEHVNLQEASGRVLAMEVFADRNFPPFDRVTMDGIAFAYKAYETGLRTFAIEGTQLAGEEAKSLQNPDAALEVMTGAVLPGSCDTVVPYEEIEITNGEATLSGKQVKEGQNVHKEGRDQKKGTKLLDVGTLIRASEIAVLATVGAAVPRVFCLPKVAVIATGDELVAVDEHPEPYQIRSSNSQALVAALQGWGVEPEVFHIRDDKESLTEQLGNILKQNDVLLLSGGVSKGKADYLPEVLESLHVQKIFHRVAQKPGKPFWFGRIEEKKFVFAFPGNPISTFMCFHRYFLPWLKACLGIAPTELHAKLSEDFDFEPPLTYFLQVKAHLDTEGVLWAQPRSGGGSGDLANLLYANAFLELPPNRQNFKRGESLPLITYNPL
ncbi:MULTISPECIES: molybdopterin molybdotransferase MoeA [unclassified Imperialibacter]|uniref:molybdopterin molybdotransferase MoeA n=1 Tax=unclassified Imperialibacter TaxID=2629706 RepID=UPI00125A085D|nr:MULTISPECIES: molybdopterin molybdotransferase MoeA [unclassified Imperialibacter]CAD5248931.1 Molybdopterin molybdenumtransferase [Imperialibacter sp. 89]CAD5263771.1 Molybdopterin molybdenumtransferase [Imperialibacter sp. 75]VVT07474.1 Molybdopterin molybdochelatase [Imperialibacter sp. EC-SDR9]